MLRRPPCAPPAPGAPSPPSDSPSPPRDFYNLNARLHARARYCAQIRRGGAGTADATRHARTIARRRARSKVHSRLFTLRLFPLALAPSLVLLEGWRVCVCCLFRELSRWIGKCRRVQLLRLPSRSRACGAFECTTDKLFFHFFVFAYRISNHRGHSAVV